MAQSSPQRGPISLTDEFVECSRIVKLALDIIYTLEVDRIDEQYATTYMYVVDFAKKWEIGLISIAISKAIRASLKDVRSGTIEMMLLAWKLNDNGLASLAFAVNNDEWPANPGNDDECSEIPCEATAIEMEDEDKRLPLDYQSEDFPPFDGGAQSFGGVTFDLGACYHQYLLQITPTIVWIILKSQHLTAHDKIPVEDHFKRLMDNACKYPIYTTVGLLMSDPPPPPADTGKKRKAED